MNPQAEPTQEEVSTQDTEGSQDISFLRINYADKLSDDELFKVGNDCKQGFEIDLNSRSEWESALEDWVKLANQHREAKSFPWPNAANVKYPLLTTAAMQFNARAYPSLVPSNGKIVNAKIVGKDPDGAKFAKGQRIAKFMSYQLLEEMDGWEEDMDKMLSMLPIVGCVFKKTWYDRNEDKICSKFILPKNFVVNYWTKSLDKSDRTSEVIEMSKRVLQENIAFGIFRDADLGDPIPREDNQGYTANDDTVPYTLIEQHTYLSLNGKKEDDYPAPVIVTFELESGKVLSIYRRHTMEDVILTSDEKRVAKIKPINMYTKFGFVPNPDGSFYDIGFGVLLGPINEAVNSLINQMIDSGSLNNLQSGFIGKALKIKMGGASFTPGEWKPVNATGDDLRKQIVPLPAKEPSNVLFQLMGSLITSGKELASVAEIFTGKMPGQNTPATTTMATVEQGMKVFTAVYKRIFRSLDEEFLKIFNLNKLYLDPNKYVKVLDETVDPSDFDGTLFDIFPGADPNAVSNQEKLQKAMGLGELLQAFGQLLNPVEIVSRILEAQEQPNWEKLLAPQVAQTGQAPEPQPDPKLMAIQQKGQLDQQKAQMTMAQKQQDMELKGRDAQVQMAMAAQEHAQKMQEAGQTAQISAASELAKNHIFLAAEMAKQQQALQHNAQTHAQKLQQSKETQSLSRAQSSKSGTPTK